MGFTDFLFGGGGGFGQDNPEFRNFSEYSGVLQQLGLLAQENPEVLKQYFSTPSGQQEMSRLGFGNVDDLLNYATQMSPNIAGSGNYADLASQIGGLESGAGMTFDDILSQQKQLEDYIGGMSGDLGSNLQMSLDDIMNVPDEAYSGVQGMMEEQAARGFEGALDALSQRFGDRGFRSGSGLEQAEATGLGRGYLEQLSNIGRDIGLQKAQAQTQYAQNMAAQDLARANYLTDLQKYAKNFGLNKSQSLQNALAQRGQMAGYGAQTRSGLLGQQGQMYGQQDTAALTPYGLGQNYYSGTAGMTGPQGKKGIFGDLMQTGASVASAALL